MRIAKIFWYAQWQKFLVCAGAGQFGMRRRRSIWYAQAQVNLVCASAGHFGMRKRRSIWYAQAQDILVCASAGHLVCASAGQFGMRKRRTFWYAQAQINLVCAGADQFGMRRRRPIFHAQAQVIFFFFAQGRIVWYLLTWVLFETDFRLFFSMTSFLVLKQFTLFYLPKAGFVTIALDDFKICFRSANHFLARDNEKVKLFNL